MGAWGAGLYQDDVTCDVKEEYLNQLRIGKSNEEATDFLLDSYSDCANDDEDCDCSLFWFALADTQWKYGRLEDRVKKEALRQIKLGNDLERWQENGTRDYNKRKAVLHKLEEELNSIPPKEKKVSKLIMDKAAWEVGDVLLYQFKTDDLVNPEWKGKYILLRVVGISRTNIGSLPRNEYFNEQNIAAIYNWVGSSKPDLSIINKLQFVPQKNIFGKIVDAMCTLTFSKRELKKIDFKVIMKEEKYKKKSAHIMDCTGITWLNTNNMDYFFSIVLKNAKDLNILIDET